MIKRSYIEAAHAIAMLPPIRKLYAHGNEAAESSWAKWLLSLGAIYDIDRMVRLDVPWWNVRATQEVASFLARRSRARVFEFGSGASSVWLAGRASSLVTVEHDAAWATKVGTHLKAYDNSRLLTAELHSPDGIAPSPYLSAIDGTGDYDLIVVDGRRRIDCLTAAIPHLKRDGLILFDDSGRRRYRAGIAQCGLQETHYFGRSFCVPYPDHSSLLKR
jgi:hypothetical protein